MKFLSRTITIYIKNFIVIGGALLLASCGGGGTSTPDVASTGANLPSSLPATMTSANGATLTYALQPGVRVFNDGEAATITSVIDNGTELVLTANSPVAAGMMFIANGAAFKVSSLSTVGGVPHATVTTPSMHEIFSNVKVQGTINVSDLTTVPTTTAATLKLINRATAASPVTTLTDASLTRANSIHYDLPISQGIAKGTLGIDVTGSIFFDISFTEAGVFEKSVAQFNGAVTVDGSINITQPIGKTTLASQTFEPPCYSITIPLGEIPIPNDVCMPISVSVDFSAEAAGVLPVHYSQVYVAGVAYPASSVPTLSDSTPAVDNTVPAFSGLDVASLIRCATVNVTLSNNLKIEPKFNLLKTFTIASLPSSLAYAGTLKTRLDLNKIPATPAFTFASDLKAKVDAKVGFSTPMLDNESYTSSLTGYVKHVAAQKLLNKVIGGINGITFYEASLIDATYPVSRTAPLPSCLKVSAGAITPSGQATTVAIDPLDVDPAIKQTISVLDPTGKQLPGATGVIDQFPAPTPGVYIITLTETNGSGQKTTQQQPYSVIPAGTYVGQFTGNDSGNATAVISSTGAISASGNSNRFGNVVIGSGQVSSNGVFTVGGTTAGGAIFSGTFTPSNGIWIINGTWSKASSGLGGTFTLVGNR